MMKIIEIIRIEKYPQSFLFHDEGNNDGCEGGKFEDGDDCVYGNGGCCWDNEGDSAKGESGGCEDEDGDGCEFEEGGGCEFEDGG